MTNRLHPYLRMRRVVVIIVKIVILGGGEGVGGCVGVWGSLSSYNP